MTGGTLNRALLRAPTPRAAALVAVAAIAIAFMLAVPTAVLGSSGQERSGEAAAHACAPILPPLPAAANAERARQQTPALCDEIVSALADPGPAGAGTETEPSGTTPTDTATDSAGATPTATSGSEVVGGEEPTGVEAGSSDPETLAPSPSEAPDSRNPVPADSAAADAGTAEPLPQDEAGSGEKPGLEEASAEELPADEPAVEEPAVDEAAGEEPDEERDEPEVRIEARLHGGISVDHEQAPERGPAYVSGTFSAPNHHGHGPSGVAAPETDTGDAAAEEPAHNAARGPVLATISMHEPPREVIVSLTFAAAPAAMPRTVTGAVAVAVELGRAGGGWASALVFNVWLRRQLRERRMSQRQLAVASGVSNSTISRLLTGKRMPTLETATRLAGALRKIGGADEAAGYFEALTHEDVMPASRVEHALRADEDLDDADVWQLMQHYLTARKRRRMLRNKDGLSAPVRFDTALSAALPSRRARGAEGTPSLRPPGPRRASQHVARQPRGRD